MLHVVKLLVECQSHIIYFKLGMLNYCFIRVSEYMLVFVMVFANRFGKVALVVAGNMLILCKSFGFVSL